jgi:hypothetical protein
MLDELLDKLIRKVGALSHITTGSVR